MAGLYNFTINKKTDFERPIKWKNSDGSYIDFTGYIAVMPIRYGNKKGELAIELSNVDGIVIDEEILTIKLTDIQTSVFKSSPCYYNLDLTKDDNTIRLIEGRIDILENVPTEE